MANASLNKQKNNKKKRQTLGSKTLFLLVVMITIYQLFLTKPQIMKK
jgi:hypothetical protein